MKPQRQNVLEGASVNDSSPYSMVACFDLSSEKFSFVKFVETFSKSMEYSTKMAVVVERMLIDGLVGTNEIVLSPSITKGPAYVIYYNVERKTTTKVLGNMRSNFAVNQNLWERERSTHTKLLMEFGQCCLRLRTCYRSFIINQGNFTSLQLTPRSQIHSEITRNFLKKIFL
ncbi:BnaC04g43000D [Brassica napus]|uniref:(rape) hypothetical protein n=1 Tax=Brassica napus TaxID=3708 RepID=A0A078FSP3_BRANA|nr:unnamed protein product [Brassica napus]CDY15323.1 BnaC04g43000D [Brassica napus]